MPKITLEVSEELSQQLAQVGEGDRLPELLALSLQQLAVPAQVYRYILDFLASNRTPPRLRGGETKHSFGGVGFFGFNEQSNRHNISIISTIAGGKKWAGLD